MPASPWPLRPDFGAYLVLAAMDKKLASGLASFALAYLVLGLAATAGLDAAGWKGPWTALLVIDLGAPLFAVLVGVKLGRLNAPGVAVCSLVLALLSQAAVVYILGSLARRSVGDMQWLALYRPPYLGNTVIGLVAIIAGPLVWLAVLRRVAPRLAANNSSKPTPLRGAA